MMMAKEISRQLAQQAEDIARHYYQMVKNKAVNGVLAALMEKLASTS